MTGSALVGIHVSVSRATVRLDRSYSYKIFKVFVFIGVQLQGQGGITLDTTAQASMQNAVLSSREPRDAASVAERPIFGYIATTRLSSNPYLQRVLKMTLGNGG